MWSGPKGASMQERLDRAAEAKKALLERFRSAPKPGDPAYELEQSLAVEERMEMTADAVQSLHSRQQRAIICSLKERVDDAIHLKNALAARHIDVETIVWPDNKADKQLLKASISAARKNIAQFMSITLPCKVSTSSHCCI